MLQKMMDNKQNHMRANSQMKVDNKFNSNLMQQQEKNKTINSSMFNSHNIQNHSFGRDENKNTIQKDFQQKLEIFKQQFSNQSQHIQMSKQNAHQQNDKLIQFKKSLDNLDKQRKIMHKKIQILDNKIQNKQQKYDESDHSRFTNSKSNMNIQQKGNTRKQQNYQRSQSNQNQMDAIKNISNQQQIRKTLFRDYLKNRIGEQKSEQIIEYLRNNSYLIEDQTMYQNVVERLLGFKN